MSDADAAFEVVAEGLWRSFSKGGRTIDVLRGIDLRLDPGEQVSVMGRSGAGKSTLLHLLGALDRPSAGSLRLGGRELSSLGDRELSALRCRHVGMVFQFHHLLPEFTAVENVIMPAVVAGETFEDARERALRVLGEMELDHRIDHRPGELSGGEQQRVALARALVHRPQLVLADEPTGNLDQRTGAAVHELLLDAIASRGAILVLVTHDPDLASSVERKLELREGVLEELT
ncbi:MAG: ABC transporter ATP-binding protein [Myxococcota bacterium]|nr:ABC transporter ATP-binding protein [Myxococcota bacterium]